MERKWKMGDIHPETGMIFWSYTDRNCTREGWHSPEVYEKKRKDLNEKRRTEEGRQKQRDYYLKRKERCKKSNQDLSLSPEESGLRLVYTNIKGGAKSRKIIFDIDFLHVINLWSTQEGKCFYSKIKMKYDSFDKDPLQVSIDRIDSSIGYTKENTVLCCQAINYAKHDYSMDKWTNFINELKFSL